MPDRTVLAADGTGLWVSDRGRGPTVLLLHGLACTGAIWAPLEVRLVASHRVVNVDLRGHGRSQPVNGSFSLAAQALDIRTILEELDLHDVTVVGHSAGGYAVLAFLADYPAVARARVARVVTVGTTGSTRHLRERVVLRFACSRVFYLLFSIPSIGRRLVRAGAFGANPRADDVETTRRMALACDRRIKAAWCRATRATALEERLGPQAMPVMVTTGSRDTTVTPKRAATLADRLGARSHTFDGAGHMVPLEATEELSRLIATHDDHPPS